ncbi:MAG: DnaD domain protein, partial [Clostridia bacterium]|nr:DnaD domain protein [Clostridia bacterium]
MAFISVSDNLAKKSFTSVENKFITKYLPVLEPVAVKVYLYSLYIYGSGQTSCTVEDLANSLSLTESEVKNYFNYLEEFELVSVLSYNPFEVKILDADNVYGAPKKFKPEKYSDFTKNAQNVIKGRMISTNEYREYFYLLEEYGFEQNALIMIMNYCAGLKGDDVKVQYIKKVAKSFAEQGVTTAKKVDEKLFDYKASTSALIKIFEACGITRKADFDDEKLYKIWTEKFGFSDKAIIAAAKGFKVKTVERLDASLSELHRNNKIDVKEINDYCKNKNAAIKAAFDIANILGVTVPKATPYVENYINVWYDYGYSFAALKIIAEYCFKQNKTSFEDMNELIQSTYNDGIITEESVALYIDNLNTENAFIKEIISTCGLTKKIISSDRENLARWRGWNFGNDMILQAAKMASDKSNPVAYMNAVLSSWKAEGIFSTDKIAAKVPATKTANNQSRVERAEIEQHYYDLRHAAEDAAEKALSKAKS